MKVYGKNGLGSFLKISLEIVFALIIIMMIVVPFKIKKVIVFYPNIICLLVIMYAFIKLFDSLKKEEPFCKETIKNINIAKIASAIASVIWALQTLYEIILVKYPDPLSVFILFFMFILFLGVTIALYILKEIFIKATNYKEENDLTI